MPIASQRQTAGGFKEKTRYGTLEGVKRTIIKPNDPLFGVLEESQVGIHLVLGRPKIAPEVLEEMRQYLLLAEGEERVIREEKVRKSVREVEKDPVTERITLRLEDPPIITRDLNRGKELVFGYDTSDSTSVEGGSTGNQKLLGDSIKAGGPSSMVLYKQVSTPPLGITNALTRIVPSSGDPTDYKIGLYEATYSGNTKKKGKSRKRPYVKKRRLRKMGEELELPAEPGQSSSISETGSKRRMSEGENSDGRTYRRSQIRRSQIRDCPMPNEHSGLELPRIYNSPFGGNTSKIFSGDSFSDGDDEW